MSAQEEFIDPRKGIFGVMYDSTPKGRMPQCDFTPPLTNLRRIPRCQPGIVIFAPVLSTSIPELNCPVRIEQKNICENLIWDSEDEGETCVGTHLFKEERIDYVGDSDVVPDI